MIRWFCEMNAKRYKCYFCVGSFLWQEIWKRQARRVMQKIILSKNNKKRSRMKVIDCTSYFFQENKLCHKLGRMSWCGIQTNVQLRTFCYWTPITACYALILFLQKPRISMQVYIRRIHQESPGAPSTLLQESSASCIIVFGWQCLSHKFAAQQGTE